VGKKLCCSHWQDRARVVEDMVEHISISALDAAAEEFTFLYNTLLFPQFIQRPTKHQKLNPFLNNPPTTHLTAHSNNPHQAHYFFQKNHDKAVMSGYRHCILSKLLILEMEALPILFPRR
jgi:hypothetical protein